MQFFTTLPCSFPLCRPCNCDPAGTLEDQCDEEGNCRCDPDGNCACKANVEGMKCAACRSGTFGLSRANPDGCFHCFCFGRARTCQQANLAWTQVSHSSVCLKLFVVIL